jgi:hypothetical protein
MQRFVYGIVLVNLICTMAAADRKRLYGDALTGAPRVEIAAILASPSAYEGRIVQVAGKVRDVCKNMGCWMEIEDDSGSAIQVKVDDGVIVFPVDSVGHLAAAEGKVEIRDLSREQYVEWRQHVAEEQGRRFDPSEIGDPPFRLIRLRGLGAEITD